MAKERIAACSLLALGAIFAAAACHLQPPALAPVPALLDEIEGYASFKVTRSGETAKSKLSFVLEPSRRAKVEVLDLLSRTVAEIYVDGQDGYLILPLEKAYWKATPEEIIGKFLGSRLSLPEMTGLLCGRWRGERSGEELVFSEWAFEEDAGKRKVSGRKEDFEFKVLEFFRGSSVPRRLDFRSTDCRGTISLLAMAFNRPVAENLFALDFLERFSSKSWEDIEKILRHEN